MNKNKIIKELIEKGLTVNEIVKETNISNPTIRMYCLKMNLNPITIKQRNIKKFKKEIIDLYIKGLNKKEIIERGYSKALVKKYIIEEFGYQNLNRSYYIELVEKIKNRINNGWSYKEIKSQYNLTRSKTNYLTRHLGFSVTKEIKKYKDEQ